MGNGQSTPCRPTPSPTPRLRPKPSNKTLKSRPSKASISYTEFEKSPASSSEHTLAVEQQPLAYAPARVGSAQDDETQKAYASFLKAFPEYQLTWILDTLRRTDFSRLDRTGETYVDYMGGSLYPESLIRVHTDFLSRSVLGNTHSVSNSSKLSSTCLQDAREAVLSFFQAPPGYTVIFTANTTGALKLVGESFPFTKDSSFVLGVDSHNSVHGIRQFAAQKSANVCYIESTRQGGFDPSLAKVILTKNRPRTVIDSPCLFAMTGQSNITNSKNSLSIIDYAASLGYCTVLDAAALVPTSIFSLSETPVDAMAISFYKMFGFPTGVGALVAKESFLAKLERPWFAGGNVELVQVPGTVVTRSEEIREQFDDGTINYLNLPAVTDGLRFLSAYMPFLPLRLSSLVQFLTMSLAKLRHDATGGPVVQILSRVPTRRLKRVGDKSDTGSIISLLFLYPNGDMIPLSFVEYAATSQSISLRTGCMCNTGGAAAILESEGDMDKLYPGATRQDFENATGREIGVVRISLGLVSTFQDVWKIVRFGATIGNESTRQILWNRYMQSLDKGRKHGH